LTSPKTAADWNALLTAEGMPAEVRPIPRRHAPRAAEATFEGDLDAAVLDSVQSPPAVRRPGRRPGYDVVAAREQAAALIRDGGLTGIELQVLSLWIAGVPQRQIATEVGRSRRFLQYGVLGPLLSRAGIPTSWTPAQAKPARPARQGTKLRQ
jgi:hypothetical protein